MTLRPLLERLRDSQFFLPAGFIVGSLILAWVTHELDAGNPGGTWYLMPATVQGGRTLVATIAGAIITVAALVFSFNAVTVQLASSQYSPRVVQEFMRDRVQQTVVGVLMGTFTFALVSLATIGRGITEEARVDWTATTGVVLAVAAALLIVGYIDHITRRLRVDDTIQLIAQQTITAFSHPVEGIAPIAEGSWNLAPESASTAVRTERNGFVQHIDIAELLKNLDSASVARLDVWIGFHVIAGTRLLTVWSGDGHSPDPEHVAGAIAIGDTRTIAQDPGLGIQQLVDIALRALSPGINDPATACDVVTQLAGCVRAAHLAGDPAKVFTAPGGARLVAPHVPGFADLIESAFDQIRRAARDQPTTLQAIVDALGSLLDQIEPDASNRRPLEIQIEKAAAARQRTLAEELEGSS